MLEKRIIKINTIALAPNVITNKTKEREKKKCESSSMMIKNHKNGFWVNFLILLIVIS